MSILPSSRETKLDPNRKHHLGILRDEATEAYARFFRWPVAPLSKVARAAMAADERPAGPSTTLDTITSLLEPGYFSVETGIFRSTTQELCVAVWTPFPGSSPEMFDWWFGWHINETNRYKLWHPQAHLFTQPRYDYSSVEDLTDRQRYVGNTSWVDEYIGPHLLTIALQFFDPGEFGLPYDLLEKHDYGTAIVAKGYDSATGTFVNSFVHAMRRTPYGCELRSRFFFPAGFDTAICRALIDHCSTEMTHLASFLPHLYASITGTGPTGPLDVG
jgi:hypothetical protein